jgi:hypothetical protein
MILIKQTINSILNNIANKNMGGTTSKQMDDVRHKQFQRNRTGGGHNDKYANMAKDALAKSAATRGGQYFGGLFTFQRDERMRNDANDWRQHMPDPNVGASQRILDRYQNNNNNNQPQFDPNAQQREAEQNFMRSQQQQQNNDNQSFDDIAASMKNDLGLSS